MKNIPIYTLLIILSSVVGFEIGNQGFFVSKPSGEWEKIFESDEYPFKSRGGDISHLRISSVTRDPITYHLIMHFYLSYSQGGGKTYKCDIDDSVCLPADDLTVPVDITVHTFTHAVELSEVPEIPLSKNIPLNSWRQYVDMVRVETLGGEYTLEEYYVLLFDGSIWQWSYSSSFYTDIKRFLLSVLGGICGIVVSLFVVTANIRLSKRETNSSAKTSPRIGSNTAR